MIIFSIILAIVLIIISDGGTYDVAVPGEMEVYYDSFEANLTIVEGGDGGVVAVTAPDLDMYLFIYNGSFDPKDPTTNLIYHFNCDPFFENDNDPCNPTDIPMMSGDLTFVIAGYWEGHIGYWEVKHDGEMLASGNLEAMDPEFIRPDFESMGGDETLGSIGALFCILGPLLGMILLIVGIATRDPAAVVAMTMVGGAPIVAGQASQQIGQASAFVSQQATTLSQPVGHGSIPSAPVTGTSVPTPEQIGIDSSPKERDSTTVSEEPPTSSQTGIPEQKPPSSPHSSQVPPTADQAEPEQEPEAQTEPATKTLSMDEMCEALNDSFSATDRKEIIARGGAIEVTMKVDDVKRTMGIGIADSHRGGQTLAGKTPSGRQLEVRLPKSAAEVPEGTDWSGKTRAVDWNAIRRVLVMQAEE